MKYGIQVSGDTVLVISCVRNSNSNTLRVVKSYAFIGEIFRQYSVSVSYYESEALTEFAIVSRSKDGVPWKLYGGAE